MRISDWSSDVCSSDLGERFEEAYAHAVKVGETRGLTFVHPFDDAGIIAGQGTVALEMLETAPDIDTLVVPIGGGGLISGMAVAAKAVKQIGRASCRERVCTYG